MRTVIRNYQKSVHTSSRRTMKYYIVPTVTNKISFILQTQNIPHNKSSPDPKFQSPAKVDLQQGSDIFNEVQSG